MQITLTLPDEVSAKVDSLLATLNALNRVRHNHLPGYRPATKEEFLLLLLDLALEGS
jgi:hypothetical protein